MFTIIGKQSLGPVTRRVDIRADELVARMKPGHFVAIMVDGFSRIMPFNIYDIDWRRKCFSIVFDEVDAETEKLATLKINDKIFAVKGPYGHPVQVEKKGTILCVGEGMGLASLICLCRAFKAAGNKVIGIAGFESRKVSMFENQMRLHCYKSYFMYKDGVGDRRGDILGPLHKVLADGGISEAYIHVSPQTYQDVVSLTWPAGFPVWLNIMDLLTARPGFFETTSFDLKTGRLTPAAEGIFVDASRIDVHELMGEVRAWKEYQECRKNAPVRSPSSNVFTRWMRSIWG